MITKLQTLILQTHPNSWPIEGKGRELLSEHLGGGVRQASSKPLPYFRPKYVIFPTLFQTWGTVVEAPETFSHPKSQSKISNLLITELSYSMIFLKWQRSLHTMFQAIHFSVFKIPITKNSVAGLRSFRGF